MLQRTTKALRLQVISASYYKWLFSILTNIIFVVLQKVTSLEQFQVHLGINDQIPYTLSQLQIQRSFVHMNDGVPINN